jgi:hypothetical protein
MKKGVTIASSKPNRLRLAHNGVEIIWADIQQPATFDAPAPPPLQDVSLGAPAAPTLQGSQAVSPDASAASKMLSMKHDVQSGWSDFYAKIHALSNELKTCGSVTDDEFEAVCLILGADASWKERIQNVVARQGLVPSKCWNMIVRIVSPVGHGA